ncbi:hypothetical protein [Clostridium sp. E02]|uniref:hypothetical protein n=1 Tax=Clostridium sp. E02 TaxID=2487134 RepID=UPI000F547E99|nr:hypothetical protein [Clostridium sp. E02]
MRKRILAIILSATVGITPLVGGANTVYAAETQVSTTAVQQLAMPQESDYVTTIAPQSWGSKVVKSAIKFIIKNKSAAAKVIEKVSGKTVAKNFLKHFTKITAAIEPLLEWSEIPAQAVYDAVFRGLYNAGVSRAVATNIALAIKEGLSWFI